MRYPPPLGPKLLAVQGLICALLGAALLKTISVPLRPLTARGGAPQRPAVKRLVIVHLDALRGDFALDPALMPTLNRLAREGASGTARTPAVTTTGPSLQTIFTGEPVDVLSFLHNFTFPVHKRYNLIPIAHAAGKKLVFIGPTISSSFRKYNARRGKVWPERSYPASIGSDRAILEKALEVLANRDFDLLTVLLYSADHSGHLYTPHSKEYRDDVRFYDQALARIAEKLDQRDTALLVYGDHGIDDEGFHSTAVPSVRRPRYVFWGAPFAPGVRLDIEQKDMTPTIAELMGLPAPPRSRGRLMAEAFGFGPRRLAGMLLRNMRQRTWTLAGSAGARDLVNTLAAAEWYASQSRYQRVRRTFTDFEEIFRSAEKSAYRHEATGKRALIASLLAAAVVLMLPALGVDVRSRPWPLVLFAAALAFPWCPAAQTVLNAFASFSRGLSIAPIAAAIAGLALFLPLLRMELKGERGVADNPHWWLCLALLASALLSRLLAENGTHGLYLAATALCFIAGFLPAARIKSPSPNDLTGLAAAAFVANGVYYNFRAEILISVFFCAALAFVRRRILNEREAGLPRAVLTYLGLRLFIFFAAGNDLQGRLNDLTNVFLLGSEGTFNIPMANAAIFSRIFLAELLLVTAFFTTLIKHPSLKTRLGAFTTTVAGCYGFLVAAAVLRIEARRAGPVLDWTETQLAWTGLGMLLMFLAAATALYIVLRAPLRAAEKLS